MSFDVDASTILLCRHGSHAYGTNLPESDIDLKGVAVPPKRFVLGFSESFKQKETRPDPEDPNSVDGVTYEVRKFFSLAASCNPNIIEVLFVDDSDLIRSSKEGDLIRSHREKFLSGRIRYTFSGYALGQLKRIRTHKKWLLDPPKKKPERGDFGLGNLSISPDMLGAFDKILSSENVSESQIHPNVMELVQAEKAYRAELLHWNQFLNWKANRNEKRAELEAKFGYDTKHAMHLVRLLRMCREIVEGKGVRVKRPDAEELLSIRRGAWTYEELISWAEEEDAKVRTLPSSLPKEPDVSFLDDLVMRVQESFWSRYSPGR